MLINGNLKFVYNDNVVCKECTCDVRRVLFEEADA